MKNAKQKIAGMLMISMLMMNLIPGELLQVSATSGAGESIQTVTNEADGGTTETGTSGDEGGGTTSEGASGSTTEAATDEGSTEATTETTAEVTTEFTTEVTTETSTEVTTETTEASTELTTEATTEVTTESTTETAAEAVRDPNLVPSGLSPAESKVLVIDPGHCDKHPGAHANGLKEEEVVLDISLAFEEALNEYGDITVYLTREDGGCCEELGLGECLYSRNNYAKSLDADLLVSDHINAGHLSGANLLVAYKSGYHDNIRIETQRFGRIALKNLHALGIKNQGFLLRKSGSGLKYDNGKTADYYSIVRRGVVQNIPSVIIEHGYVTSTSDCKKFFSTKAKREKLGQADAKSVVEYFGLSKKVVVGQFQLQNDSTYYVNAEGKKITGWVKSEGIWYYFDEDTGKMHSGLLTQGEDTFFLSPSTGEMVVGWFTLDGYDYFTRGNGTLVKGMLHEDGVASYLFDMNGVRLKKGFHTVGDSTYYMVNNKKAAKGLTRVGSRYYGFDPETGVMLYGYQELGKKGYYFDPETGVAAEDKIVTIDEERYYFNKKAAEQTGWVKYKGAKYYFEKDSGEMVTGWKKIKKKYYYFDQETGKMQTKKWIGNYYVNSKGIRTKKK